jgi:hypothetical protein
MVESGHYLGRVGFLREGNEGVEVEGGAQLDSKITSHFG